MAFWNASKMDSWNPFSRKFWSCRNLFGKSITEELEETEETAIQTQWQKLKDELQAACDIPIEFSCPIESELIDPPVITEYGIVYSEAGIKNWFDTQSAAGLETRCPVSDQPIQLDKLQSPMELKELVRAFKEDRADILSRINNMQFEQETFVRARLAEYHDRVNKRIEALKALQQSIHVQAIKNKSKINKDDIEFWRKQESTSFRISRLWKKKGEEVERKMLPLVEAVNRPEVKTVEDLRRVIQSHTQKEQSSSLFNRLLGKKEKRKEISDIDQLTPLVLKEHLQLN